jgi:hypothetical protein
MKKTVISLSENQGYRQDLWYSSSNATNDPIIFYETKQISQSSYAHPKNEPKVYMQYLFQEAYLYTIYQRKYYDIFEVLAVSGGIYSSIYLIGFGFTIAFSYNLMMASLMRSLYAFNAKFPQEIKPKKKSKKGKKDDSGDDKPKPNEVINLDDSMDDDEMRLAK